MRTVDPDPDDTDDARAALIRGYATRYERCARDLWQSAGKSHADIGVVAAYVVAAARASSRAWQPICDEVLDGAFADAWMVAHRWPWASIAKDPARFRAHVTGPASSAPALHPALARLEAARRAEHVGRIGDDDGRGIVGPEEQTRLVAELHAAQDAWRAASREAKSA